MKSHFDSPRDVLGWASEAIEEIKPAGRAFFDGKNFHEIRQFDPADGCEIIKIVQVGKFPPLIARKATEALSNIKHSFDQSLFAACCAIGKSPKESIYFPWADSVVDLEHRLGATPPRTGKTRKIKIPPELWPVLRGFEPYRRGNGYAGGNDLVREMAQVANRKHTVSVSFDVFVTGINYQSFSGSTNGKFLELGGTGWDPVKKEIVIARVPPGIERSGKNKIDVRIFFNDPTIRGAPVVGSLRHFLAKAKTVLDALEREAKVIAP